MSRIRHWKTLGTHLGWRVAAALVTFGLIAGFVVVFASARGSQQHPAQRLTSSEPTVETTAETAAAPTTGVHAATATATAAGQPIYVRITANQDYRFVCLAPPVNYAVTLRNVGDVVVTWQLQFPYTPQPDRYPYWGGVGEKGLAGPAASGTLAAGATSNLLIWPQAGYPCAGNTYQATIHLKLPNGRSQPDLRLTYAGSGPNPFVHLAVTHNQTYTERCAGGVAPPPPYTVTITNTGNVRANIQPLPVEQAPSLQFWAQVGTTSPTWWIGPNSTMDLVITPLSWIGCGAQTYHVKVGANSSVGMLPDLMLADTVTS